MTLSMSRRQSLLHRVPSTFSVVVKIIFKLSDRGDDDPKFSLVASPGISAAFMAAASGSRLVLVVKEISCCRRRRQRVLKPERHVAACMCWQLDKGDGQLEQTLEDRRQPPNKVLQYSYEYFVGWTHVICLGMT